MRDPALVAMIWAVTAGLTCHLHTLVAAVSVERIRWQWLDVLSVPALVVAFWLGFHLFSAATWAGLVVVLIVHGYAAWLGSARMRERLFTSLLLWRSRSRLAAALFLVLVAIFSAVQCHDETILTEWEMFPCAGRR